MVAWKGHAVQSAVLNCQALLGLQVEVMDAYGKKAYGTKYALDPPTTHTISEDVSQVMRHAGQWRSPAPPAGRNGQGAAGT